MTAQEAFDKTYRNLCTQNTEKELEETLEKITKQAEMGHFVNVSNPMIVEKAEKLALDLEELGYWVNVQGCGQPMLAIVVINWKHKPTLSRLADLNAAIEQKVDVFLSEKS